MFYPSGQKGKMPDQMGTDGELWYMSEPPLSTPPALSLTYP